MTKIVVTIEGPQGSGKTLLAELFHDALMNAGATAQESPDENCPTWTRFGSEISIVEKLDV